MFTTTHLAMVPLTIAVGILSSVMHGLALPATAQDTNQPATTIADWIAQIEATTVQITSVQVASTDTGLRVVLATDGGELATPTPTVSGNALIAEIPNAMLSLSEGEEFQQFEPMEGIALISATNVPDNRVRLVITGSDAPPVIDISTEAQELTFSVMPGSEPHVIEAEDDAIQVIVTAEKTPEDVQDVPISLTVLTEQDIEDTDITSFEDVAGNVPNFVIFSGDAASSPFYSIRGIGNFNFLSREATAFYVDDVPYDRIGFVTTDLPDIAQVEVLRGPQSTLYGRNALSGVVNITTRRPTSEFEFDGVASYGNFGAVDLRAGISGPLADEDLFFRLSGQFSHEMATLTTHSLMTM